MLKQIAGFISGLLSSKAITELIKEQITKNAPKLTDEQKQELLNVITQLVKAAAAGAAQGTTKQ